MDAFEKELMRRSPLAASVLEICDYLFDPAFLDSIWSEHRGRCYQDVLRFNDFLRLTRDALVRYQGSAHALFIELESKDANPIDESNFYRKLAHMPIELSRALLRESTVKLSGLMPLDATVLPGCFESFEVLACDGKKIKNAAKRLAPTRGYVGKLIGAKALVAINLRSGLAVAMSDSLDGLTNDVPLVPALMDQLRQVIHRPILSVWDRQFDDVRTMNHLVEREGDSFVVRTRTCNTFVPESAVESVDDMGRRITDEIGLMGRGKNTLRVRRITLRRVGEEDVMVLTNLMDREAFAAGQLPGLYKLRWGIEQMFQQVTETFSLKHLIGSEPRAVLLQFSYCLLLYNVAQVVKAYVADDGKVLMSVVSMFYLFADIRKELVAWAYHGGGSWPHHPRDQEQMRRRLGELLAGSWDPIAYAKAPDKSPRKKPPPTHRLHGGHSSVLKVLNGTARVVKIA